MSNVGSASTKLAVNTIHGHSFEVMQAGLSGLVDQGDLGPGVTGAAGSETPSAAPLSLAERKAATLAMLAAVEAEESAVEPHPLALAVRRTDTFSQGLDQRTGCPQWVTWR